MRSYTRGAVSFVNGRAARSRQRKGLAGGFSGCAQGTAQRKTGSTSTFGDLVAWVEMARATVRICCAGSRVQQWEGV